MSVGTTYTVRRFHDPAAFLAAAEPWLLRDEAEHNLIIGIAHQLAAGTLISAKPVYLATVEGAAGIVGCAFRTPPYKLGLTRVPADAIATLADDVARVYDAIPAVMGERATARAFADAWTRMHPGVTCAAGMEGRIYQLDRVIPPGRPPRGRARTATNDDIAHAASWIDAFSREAGIHTDNTSALAGARIKQRSLYFWEVDGAAVSMAAWSGETPHGRRVGYVYTPPEWRGAGFATALVAHVSERILEDGCTFCFLYTDLANPTSNSIYQQIGYRPVCDVIDWNLITTVEDR